MKFTQNSLSVAAILIVLITVSCKQSVINDEIVTCNKGRINISAKEALNHSNDRLNLSDNHMYFIYSRDRAKLEQALNSLLINDLASLHQEILNKDIQYEEADLQQLESDGITTDWHVFFPSIFNENETIFYSAYSVAVHNNDPTTYVKFGDIKSFVVEQSCSRDDLTNVFKDRFHSDVTGHNIDNAYLSSFVSNEIYRSDPNSNLRSHDQFKEKFQNLGMDRFDFFDSPTSSPYGTNVVIMSNEYNVIICFRGTENLNNDMIPDWMTDFGFLPSPHPEFGAGVMLHGGFWNGYADVRNQIKSVLAKHMYSPANLEPKHIWLTGHSLGGALATICALDIRVNNSTFPVNGVYTFGCPRVGNDAYKQVYINSNVNYQRYVYKYDIVTTYPPSSTPLPGYIPIPIVNNFIGDGDTPALFLGGTDMTPLNTSHIFNANDHSMSNYMHALYALIPVVQQAGIPQ